MFGRGVGKASLTHHVVKHFQGANVDCSMRAGGSSIILVNGNAPVLTSTIGVYRHPAGPSRIKIKGFYSRQLELEKAIQQSQEGLGLSFSLWSQVEAE
jgi:hypothetical protein